MMHWSDCVLPCMHHARLMSTHAVAPDQQITSMVVMLTPCSHAYAKGQNMHVHSLITGISPHAVVCACAMFQHTHKQPFASCTEMQTSKIFLSGRACCYSMCSKCGQANSLVQHVSGVDYMHKCEPDKAFCCRRSAHTAFVVYI